MLFLFTIYGLQMTQQNSTSAYRRFRLRSKTLLRDNKLVILAELIIALAIIVGYLKNFVPFSETPFLFLLGWLSLRLRGIGWPAVGLKRPERWSHTILLGIAVGIVSQFFCGYVLEPLIFRLTGKLTDLSQFAPIEGNVFLLCLFLLIVWTLAAFGEELVYRAYLMNRVADVTGRSSVAWVVSLVVVSIVFGVGHLSQGLAGVIANISAGLVYGGLYLASGRNLWAPIIAHGVYDTLGLLLIFSGKYHGV
jgi:membrane protease YdiL (CAAX protease family)